MKEQDSVKEIFPNQEQKLITNFLKKPCRCGQNCQNKFSAEELFAVRADFRALSRGSKNCFMLSQLRSCQKNSNSENQQVGPIYFKTARKAQLFGVCSEGIPQQVNYLIDEADFIENILSVVILVSLLSPYIIKVAYIKKLKSKKFNFNRNF